MTTHLDTGAVLRALLADGDPLSVWDKWDRAYSSELMGAKARRAIDRLRVERAIDDEGVADAYQALAAVERAISAVRLTAEVLRRAGQPMPTVVKTLDASPFGQRPALRAAPRDRSRVRHVRSEASDSLGRKSELRRYVNLDR